MGQLSPETPKFQIVGTLHHFFGLLGEILRQGEGEVVGLLLRHRPFIRTGLDLVEQDVARPAELGRGAEVVEAGSGDGEFVQDQQILSPGDFCDKLSQKVDDCLICQFGHSL